MADSKDTAEVKTGAGSEPVIVEEPLTLRIDGAVFNLMRTPGHEQELALGFCLNEGIIGSLKDVLSLAYTERGDVTERNTLDVRLCDEIAVDRSRLTRAVNVRSSCGLCGREMIDDVVARGHAWEEIAAPAKPSLQVSRATLLKLPALMRENQPLLAKTSAAQAAAVFTISGRLVVCREDIGRHNALDKAVGHLLMGKIEIKDKVLLLSGQVTYELMAKSYHAGFSIVAAISPPTSLAVTLADKAGLTLIGFPSAKSITIYTHPGRVQ
jgi:FdhD protein